MTRVELRIDELVLDGFDPRDRRRIGEAVERALEARLAATEVGAWPSEGIRTDVLRAPDARIGHVGAGRDPVADALGASIALGVIGGSVGLGPRGTAASGAASERRSAGVSPTSRSERGESR